jgi:uncharacterized protein YjbJ (UPF0337 family)
MNEDILKGKWHEIKGNITQKWNKLTDDDLGQLKGSTEELLGLLQKRYGYQKDYAKKQIDDFIKEMKK